VVEPPVPYDVPQRPDGTGLRFPRAEHQGRHPGENERAGTHRAGLHRHHQRAAVQVPASGHGGGAAQRQDLGVCGGIAPPFALVAGQRQLLAGGVVDHRADRNVHSGG
jgi:hypothetical protein